MIPRLMRRQSALTLQAMNGSEGTTYQKQARTALIVRTHPPLTPRRMGRAIREAQGQPHSKKEAETLFVS